MSKRIVITFSTKHMNLKDLWTLEKSLKIKGGKLVGTGMVLETMIRDWVIEIKE